MQYATIKETEKGLVITLTAEGRRDLVVDENAEVYNELGNRMTIDDVIEPYFGNGWSSLRPEQIGAMTSSPLLSFDVKFDDDHNQVLEVGNVYYFPNYMVENEVKTLVECGEVIFPLAPNTECEAA